MADRPILFSAPMVRALLAGTKTQTRRGLSLRGYKDFTEFQQSDTQGYHWAFRRTDMCWAELRHEELLALLPWKVGDRLWVKETWSHTGTGVWATKDVHNAQGGEVIYRATDDRPGAGWFPSIFMFRKLSRLTLTVTDVRVERLKDISDDDALAEGIYFDEIGYTAGHMGGIGGCNQEWSATPEIAYANLWRLINGRESWDQNPWVVALTFEVEQRNIDN